MSTGKKTDERSKKGKGGKVEGLNAQNGRGQRPYRTERHLLKTIGRGGKEGKKKG